MKVLLVFPISHIGTVAVDLVVGNPKVISYRKTVTFEEFEVRKCEIV